MMGRERLLDLLVEHSYQYCDTPKFRLSSGALSRFYIDCKATTMRREAAPLIAAAVHPFIPSNVKAVGGLTMGADPIAYAIRDFGEQVLDAFVVRKEAKEHGLERLVEGPVGVGMPVLVVDDVVTSGGSTIQALKGCRSIGLEVVAVVVLVDREEQDGMERVRAEAGNLPVTAVFTRTQIHSRWEQRSQHAHTDSARPQATAG